MFTATSEKGKSFNTWLANKAEKTRRIRAIIVRWLSFMLLSTMAAAVFVMLAPIAHADWPRKYWSGYWPLPAMFIGLVLFLRMFRNNLNPIRHLGSFWCCPPPWYAAVLAMVQVIAFAAFNPSFLAHLDKPPIDPLLIAYLKPGLCGLALSTALLFVGSLALERLRRSKTHEPPFFEGNAVPDDPTGWFLNDDPIDRPGRDIHGGHTIVARRLAQRLLFSAGEAKADTAIVGALGAGKTTILHLVRWFLRIHPARHQTVVIVDVSLWPFNNEEAAISAILTAVNREFDRHVSTLGIRGVPAQYVALVSPALNSFWGFLLRSISLGGSPKSLLAKYDRMALLLGMRLVIWVEDLERFCGLDVSIAEGEHSGQHAKVVRALLHAVEELRQFSVVLATTDLMSLLDLRKIARNVEQVPLVPPPVVWRMVASFRRETFLRSDTIDAALPRERRDFELLDDVKKQEEWNAGWSLGEYSPAQAIAVLLKNMRTMRDALLLCDDVWRGLVGEIDFDDLLLLSVLRVSEPGAMALIDEHIDELRATTTSSVLKATNREFPFQKKLNDMLQGRDAQYSCAIWCIVKTVFGKLGEARETFRRKPQGFTSTIPDNWRRFMSGESGSNTPKTQPILREIVNWNHAFESAGHQEHELVARLLHPETCTIVESFGDLIGDRPLMALLEDVVSGCLSLDARGWINGEPPAIISIWRLMLRRQIPEEDVAVLIMRVLNAAVTNLAIAQCILHFFVVPSTSAKHLVGDLVESVRESFHKAMISGLVEPEDFRQSLEGAPRFTLWWACWGIDRVRALNLEGEPFVGWQSFAVRLVEAARVHPRSLLSQIVWFVVDISTDQPFEKCTYNPSRFDTLFSKTDLRHVFLQNPPGDWLERNVISAYETAYNAVLRDKPSR